MSASNDIAAARSRFAQDLKNSAPIVNNPSIVEAFTTVPREDYLGKGPWRVHSRMRIGLSRTISTDDPRQVYHDVLVSIDDEKGINTGQPSLWALVFDQLNLKPGQTILQVGAGAGYFTAILAELVGKTGRVFAYEIDKALALRAKENLSRYEQVEVFAGDATQSRDLPALDVVIVFAGVTHVPEQWLKNLAPGGQIVLPFTTASKWGFMLLLERDGDRFPVRPLFQCGFYHCDSARRGDEEKALANALVASGGMPDRLGEYHLRKGDDQITDAWLTTDTYWISKG
ncbi:MAG: protein-L-isoaspartate O-methyltransferase [Rhizobiaceae bacterium]